MNTSVFGVYRRSVRVLAYFAILCAITLLMAGASAESLYNLGLKKSVMERLDEELAKRIRDTLIPASTREEVQLGLDMVLEEPDLPDDVRLNLTLKRAEYTLGEEAIAIYESLLDDTRPLENAFVRSRIMSTMSFTDHFGKELDLLTRFDALMAPLLAVPEEEYDLRTMSTVINYATRVRRLGYSAATPLKDPRRVAGSHGDRQVLAAQVRLYYAEKSHLILSALLDDLERRIKERGPDGAPTESVGRTLEDPLAKKINALERELGRAEYVISLSMEDLDKYDAVPDEAVALAAIDKYLLRGERDVIDEVVLETEEEKIARRMAKAQANTDRLNAEIRARAKEKNSSFSQVPRDKQEAANSEEESSLQLTEGLEPPKPATSPRVENSPIAGLEPGDVSSGDEYVNKSARGTSALAYIAFVMGVLLLVVCVRIGAKHVK